MLPLLLLSIGAIIGVTTTNLDSLESFTADWAVTTHVAVGRDEVLRQLLRIRLAIDRRLQNILHSVIELLNSILSQLIALRA